MKALRRADRPIPTWLLDDDTTPGPTFDAPIPLRVLVRTRASGDLVLEARTPSPWGPIDLPRERAWFVEPEEQTSLQDTIDVVRAHAVPGLLVARAIDRADVAALVDLPALERLELRDVRTGGRALAPLARLPALRELVLVGRTINDAALPVLARCARLESLDVAGGASLSLEGLQAFRACPSLRRMCFATRPPDEVAIRAAGVLPGVDLRIIQPRERTIYCDRERHRADATARRRDRRQARSVADDPRREQFCRGSRSRSG